jgi:hypothetical protein
MDRILEKVGKTHRLVAEGRLENPTRLLRNPHLRGKKLIQDDPMATGSAVATSTQEQESLS